MRHVAAPARRQYGESAGDALFGGEGGEGGSGVCLGKAIEHRACRSLDEGSCLLDRGRERRKQAVLGLEVEAECGSHVSGVLVRVLHRNGLLGADAVGVYGRAGLSPGSESSSGSLRIEKCRSVEVTCVDHLPGAIRTSSAHR